MNLSKTNSGNGLLQYQIGFLYTKKKTWKVIELKLNLISCSFELQNCLAVFYIISVVRSILQRVWLQTHAVP